jgi:queuine/archaeosine tRNA-ribosyltransferase
VILLDSGNYESYWTHDNDWTPDKFAQVLEAMIFPISFCFDDQHPPNELDLLVAGVEEAVLRDQSHSKYGTVLPIVHAPTELLPQAVAAVANRLHPLMIAVPERELGEGILSRAETVVRIRTALNRVDDRVPLHLLGTGNPRSVLLYVACGADSFDGLEWCQTANDSRTGFLHHFQQREFFEDGCRFCQCADLSYSVATLAHNLLFYRRWMHAIRKALASRTLDKLLDEHLPAKTLARLKEKVPIECP